MINLVQFEALQYQLKESAERASQLESMHEKLIGVEKLMNAIKDDPELDCKTHNLLDATIANLTKLTEKISTEISIMKNTYDFFYRELQNSIFDPDDDDSINKQS